MRLEAKATELAAALPAVVLVFIFGALPAMGQSRAGDLDPSFGSEGKVLTDFGKSEAANAAILQKDGKVVVAGRTAGGHLAPVVPDLPSGLEDSDFALARYLADGSLDPSFGDKGTVTTDFGGSDFANALAIQDDGKLIAAGSSCFSPSGTNADCDLAVARYLSNGALDLTFGVRGTVSLDRLYQEEVKAIALQSLGRIVLSGDANTYPTNFVIRLTSQGALDASFGPGFVDGFNWSQGDEQDALLLLPGEGLLVGGSKSRRFALVKYSPDGVPDLEFGNFGILTHPDPRLKQINDLALAPGEALIAVGNGRSPSCPPGFCNKEGFAMTRYDLPTVSVDPGFGDGGSVLTDFGSDYSSAAAVRVQADGNLILGGIAEMPYDSGEGKFGIARYLANGLPDGDFGDAGKARTAFGRASAVNDLVLHPDGNILAVGMGHKEPAGSPPDADLALARYRSSGPPLSADLSSTIVGEPGQVEPGRDVTYTVEISNAGPSDSGLFQVEIGLLPGGLPRGLPSGCFPGAGTVNCTAEGLAAGQSAQFIVVITASAEGTFTVPAAVRRLEGPPDLNAANDIASTQTVVKRPPVVLPDLPPVPDISLPAGQPPGTPPASPPQVPADPLAPPASSGGLPPAPGAPLGGTAPSAVTAPGGSAQAAGHPLPGAEGIQWGESSALGLTPTANAAGQTTGSFLPSTHPAQAPAIATWEPQLDQQAEPGTRYAMDRYHPSAGLYAGVFGGMLCALAGFSLIPAVNRAAPARAAGACNGSRRRIAL